MATTATSTPTFAATGSLDSSVELRAVLTAFGTQLLITFACIVAFSVLRPANKVVYQPRLKFAPEDKRPPPLPPAPTAWISPIVRTDSSKEVRSLGLDAVMFLKTAKLLFRLFLVLNMIGIPLCVFHANYAKITGKAADTGSNAPVLFQSPAVNVSTTSAISSSSVLTSSPSALSSQSATDSSLTSTLTSQTSITSSITSDTSVTTSVTTSSSDIASSATSPTSSNVIITSSSTLTAALPTNAIKRSNKGIWALKRRDAGYESGSLYRRDDFNQTIFLVLDSSLSSLSITQIDVSSPWYWLPAGLAWLISLIAYAMFFGVWSEYINLRKQYFASPEFLESLHNRTLLLTNVPEVLHKKEKLMEYINGLHLKYRPQQAFVSQDFSNIEKLVKQHEKTVLKLEKLLAKYLNDPNNIPQSRPTMKDPKSGERVDAISYLGKEIDRLETEIYTLRAAPDATRKTISAGFVSFSTVAAAHNSSKRLRPNYGALDFTSSSTLSMNLLPPATTAPTFKLCPEFSEISWDSIGIPPPLRFSRRMLALVGTLGLIGSWFLVITGIGTISDIQTLVRGNPAALAWVNDNKNTVVFLQAFIAPILLAIANYLLPKVLRILTWLQGVRSKHGLEKSVLYKLFAFFVYQMVLFGIFSSVVSSSTATDNAPVTDIYKRKLTQAINGLASKSNLYITYILAYFTGYGIEMAQGIPLIFSFIKRRFFKLSPRQQFELNQPPEFDFTMIYGTLCMAYLIGFMFSIVAPLILPFAALFFGIAFMVMKYQFMYVYEVRRETGGTWWPKVYNLLMIGVGFFQVFTLTVIFAANTGTSLSSQRQWCLVAPLPFLTAAIWIASQRFIAPRAEFVPEDAPVSSIGEGGQEVVVVEGFDKYGRKVVQEEAVGLEDIAFNPAFVKPLMKVWVWQRSKHLLDKLYTPQYSSLEDFIQKNPQALQGDAYSRKRFRLRLAAAKGNLFHQEKKSPGAPSADQAHGHRHQFFHVPPHVGASSSGHEAAAPPMAVTSDRNGPFKRQHESMSRRRQVLARAAFAAGGRDVDNDNSDVEMARLNSGNSAGNAATTINSNVEHLNDEDLEDLLPPEERDE